MHLGEKDGKPRLVMDGDTELSAAKSVVAALAAFSRASHLPEATLTLIDNTVWAMDDSLTAGLHAQASTRTGEGATYSFGMPFMTVIRQAISTFEQRPDLLEPHMDETGIMEARTFFPPSQA